MTGTLSTKITFDGSAAIGALTDLQSALAELPKASLQIIERLIDVLEPGIEIAGVGFDGASASGAGELHLVAKPSDRLLRFVAALRTGDVDLGVVEQALRHNELPSAGCVEAPADAESPVARKSTGGEAAVDSGVNDD